MRAERCEDTLYEEAMMPGVIDDTKREAAAGTHLLSMFGLSTGVRVSLALSKRNHWS